MLLQKKAVFWHPDWPLAQHCPKSGTDWKTHDIGESGHSSTPQHTEEPQQI